MRALHLAVFAVLGAGGAFARAQQPGAAPAAQSATPAASEKLLTRFLHVDASLCCGGDGLPDLPEPFPLYLHESAPDHADTAKDFFVENGVNFPLGATSIYFRQARVLGLSNTVENMKVIAKVMDISSPEHSFPVFRVEVRVVEFPVAVEKQLAGASTFAALQQKLQLRTVCLASVKGNDVDGGRAVNLQIPKNTTAPDKDAKAWPPPPNSEGCSLQFDGYPAKGGKAVTMSLRFQYASPAKDGTPAIRQEISEEADLPFDQIVALKTFTVSPHRPPVRHFAVLARCTLVDGEVHAALPPETTTDTPPTK